MASKLLRALAGASLVALVAGQAAAAEEKVLNVYNWSDYIAEDTLEKFQQETGIKVNYDVYDSNEILESKLMAGSSGYDVVMPTGDFMERFVKGKIVRPLDKSKIPNYGNLDPAIMERVAHNDPGNAHAVVYMWGTNGLGINEAKLREVLGPDVPLDSLDLLFKPEYASKIAKCGIYVLDSASEVFAVARNYLGLPPDSKDPADIEKATELWLKVRPYIQKFHSSEMINALANGDICMAFGYSGDLMQAKNRAEEAKNGVHIKYVIPKEGTLMWFDSMVIPADAPHPENAHAFINFILKPEITAAISNFVMYPNGSKASLPFIDEAVRNNPEIYPPQAVMDKLFVQTAVDPKLERIRTRAWNKIKTGI